MQSRLPVCMAVAAAGALYLPAPVVALSIAVSLGVLAAVGLRCMPGRGRRAILLVCACITAALLLGFAGAQRTRRERATAYTGIPLPQVSAVALRLSEDSRRTASGATLYVGRLESVERDQDLEASARGGVVAFLRDGPRAVRGERLHLSGTLQDSESDSGARYLLWARGQVHIEQQRPARRHMHARVEQALASLPEETQALFSAIFLGRQDDLSDRERAAFRDSGSLHALALSGLHLGILALLVGKAASRLLGRIQAVWLVMPVLIFYVWMVGPRPSLMRALLLALCGAVFMLRDRRVGMGNLLAYVFLVMVGSQPAAAETLSFQLSFSALAGIVFLSPRVERLLAGRLPRFLSVPLSAAVGAQLATTPVLANSIGTVHLVGVPASLVVVPLVTLFLYGGLALGTLGLVGLPVPAPAAMALSLSHRLLIAFGEFAGTAPALETPDGMLPQYWLCLTLTLLLVYYRELRRLHESQLASRNLRSS